MSKKLSITLLIIALIISYYSGYYTKNRRITEVRIIVDNEIVAQHEPSILDGFPKNDLKMFYIKKSNNHGVTTISIINGCLRVDILRTEDKEITIENPGLRMF